MHSSTTPYVKNDELPECIVLELPIDGDYIRTAVQTALTRLVDHGSRSDEQMARSTALLLSQPLSGNGRNRIKEYWGEVAKCIDCTSQPISVGKLHYIPMGIGDTLALSNHLQNALGVAGKPGANQFVVIRLSAC